MLYLEPTSNLTHTWVLFTRLDRSGCHEGGDTTLTQLRQDTGVRTQHVSGFLFDPSCGLRPRALASSELTYSW